MTYLAHHGILGQKWGVRRYQNKDGSLTDAGKKRYAKELDKYSKYNNIDYKKYETAKQIASKMVDAYEKQNPIVVRSAYKEWKTIDKELDERTKKLNKATEEFINERYKVAEKEARRMMEKEAKEGKISDEAELRELRVMELTDSLSFGPLASAAMLKKYTELPHYNESWYGNDATIHDALYRQLDREFYNMVDNGILGQNKVSMASRAAVAEELIKRYK